MTDQEMDELDREMREFRRQKAALRSRLNGDLAAERMIAETLRQQRERQST